MASRPVLRFAPSPNGRLHLGHAYSALFTWAAAEALGGVTLLRIEDIDTARCKPEFDAAIIEDLQWLGLSWPEPVLRQSSRFPAYAAAADRLKATGLLYPCFCTRKEVAERAAGVDPDGKPLYPGTCRNLSPEKRADLMAQGHPHQWRLRTNEALALAGPLTMTSFDLTGERSERQVRPQDWGDAVIVRKDTPTSYHLAVTVDDAFQGVTHVTRGMDLYRATDLHRLLQALLDLPAPLYCHHKLMADEGDLKLSKSRGSAGLKDLRAAGWTSDEVRRRLGF
ncbi:tRNA glutamyl-Q(34) synthetase GluQRS [Devosia nitrariae]|uniref:tRNA glutamyl-Q(34) synthetase GluQRS n=1 Tax=Devosia nitrariae TaxID=2071872 RepID=A0ABQ5W2W2_9HYPH|nr:tRNA glutamyl-Q(34) synthetase GluQRS [Devosia nitrariae]GLQ54186.1 tRNA glutamyl-Q(34) synthetase GluQRS [Devosia nitrariae]